MFQGFLGHPVAQTHILSKNSLIHYMHLQPLNFCVYLIKNYISVKCQNNAFNRLKAKIMTITNGSCSYTLQFRLTFKDNKNSFIIFDSNNMSPSQMINHLLSIIFLSFIKTSTLIAQYLVSLLFLALKCYCSRTDKNKDVKNT